MHIFQYAVAAAAVTMTMIFVTQKVGEVVKTEGTAKVAPIMVVAREAGLT